jgi:hypothetical protein
MVDEPVTSVHPSHNRSTDVDNGLDGDVENVQNGETEGMQNGIEDLEKVELEEERSENVASHGVGDGEGAGDESSHSVSTPLLAPLDQPVPSDWVTIEGDYVNVAAIYQSHLGKDIIAVPSGRPSDGIIYLILTKGSITRMKLINVFSNMHNGTHTSTPESEMIKVKAFRFEPEATNGIMTCDGERIQFGPIQGQILPSLANIMVLNKQNDKKSGH